mgnify:FL=1
MMPQEKEKGLSLLSVLVSLVIASFVIVAAMSLIDSITQTNSQYNAINQLNRKAQRIGQVLQYYVNNAGFGLPNLSGCGIGGLIAYDGSSGTSLYPLSTWVLTSSEFNGTPTFPEDGLQFLKGSSVNGGTYTTQVSRLSSLSSSTLFLTSDANIQDNDIFAVELPGTACFLAQVTNIQSQPNKVTNSSRQSSLNSSTDYEPLAQYLSSIGGPSVSASQFTNSYFIDMGSGAELTQIFPYQQSNGSIDLMIDKGVSIPSPNAVIGAPHVLATNVLGFQVQVGVGTGEHITQWESASQWQNTSLPPPILAVRIGFILASSRASANIQTPSTVQLMGSTYNVPSNFQGHLVVPYTFTYTVENNLWQSTS